MQHLLATILAGLALAAASDISTTPGLCKKPRCTGYCADGFPYDCCVVYIRDPCADHRRPLASPSILPAPAPGSTTTTRTTTTPAGSCTGPDDFECVCQCVNGSGSYFCNVDYIRDPCEPAAAAAAAA
ncbi:uncharacterized protein L3040_001409 [Drepanopeziza brunnea f. sp. 'multigermtubi']|uniref:uncharacterized protein n=1 Tax=Drepanopeziza brunnea f. sp. 'multigermtubi' TaxID=698441 RepID=UPI00238AD44D|nr:hypothetical protein L3040_001409 [Drepanopeziza brunnea f. sp. 'multigermtubi']